MILVTVGTQYFDELIDEVDDLAGRRVWTDSVYAQIGLARRLPKHIEWVRFDRDLLEKARAAKLIVTHAGTGSLCDFLPLGRPMIAVVNDGKAGNHQLEFVEQLSRVCDFCWIDSPGKLADALPRARPPQMRDAPRHGESPCATGAARLAADISSFLLAAGPSSTTQ